MDSYAVRGKQAARAGLPEKIQVLDFPYEAALDFVGSFASRAEARDARPALYEKLRIDWANPVRFGE